MDREDHVCIKYKNWSTDEEWMPSQQDPPIEIFHLDQLGRQKVPSGLPSPIAPNIDGTQNITAIKANLNKLKKYMTEEENIWWEDFISDPITRVCNDTEEWYLTDIETNQHVRETTIQPAFRKEQENLISPLGLVMTKERNIPMVSAIMIIDTLSM